MEYGTKVSKKRDTRRGGGEVSNYPWKFLRFHPGRKESLEEAYGL